MQAPTDCCDVSFLLETNHLEETANVSAKERFIKQQKEQLESDRQRLLDFAADVAKQVSNICHLWSWSKPSGFQQNVQFDTGP